MNKFQLLVEHQKALEEFEEFVLGENLQDTKEIQILKESWFREWEPLWERWLKYGLAGALGGIPSFISPAISIVTIPLSLFLFRAWRKWTDNCRAATSSKAAYNKCYFATTRDVLGLVDRDLQQLKRIKDPDQRKKVRRKLLKQRKKWERKVKDFRRRLGALF